MRRSSSAASGGAGKWYGIVVGALMIAAIANGLDIMRVDSNFQPVIKGLIILLNARIHVN